MLPGAALLLTAGCGGDDEGAGSAPSQSITVDGAIEPQSIDPGFASDIISANIFVPARLGR
jgi:hypothetical protein